MSVSCFGPRSDLRGREREGAHPRDPRMPGAREPTQTLAPPPPPIPPQVVTRNQVPDPVDES
eukprot:11502035-Prorocentrum_lima.AAC.1